jgi:hypothetical protein
MITSSTKVHHRASATRDGTTTWYASVNGERWYEVNREPTADDYLTIAAVRIGPRPHIAADGKYAGEISTLVALAPRPLRASQRLRTLRRRTRRHRARAHPHRRMST